MTDDQHRRLNTHLFPGDGKEAVAVLLCAHRRGNRRHRLLVRYINEIPHAQCERTAVSVTWQTDVIEDSLARAEAEGLSFIKIHSHPNGYPAFSAIDDQSDGLLLPMVRDSTEIGAPHGSAVMLPSGEVFGRVLTPDGLIPIECINVVGDDLRFWYPAGGDKSVPSFAASHAQIFDDGTIERLRRLSVAVVGCSGTGSPVIEQLFRLGVGEIVLVDDDHIEDRNVNRILNSTMDDAAKKRPKPDVIGDAIDRAGLGTRVIRVTGNLWSPHVVREVAQCDVVFGCMDTIDGRYLLNTLATFYLQPYFDIGVRLDAVREGANKGKIREVCGTIHYLLPGKSSLMMRGLFTMKQVADAGLRRTDPAAHAQQTKDGYIAGVQGHRPAVISVNMYAASLAVNELLARLHPFREESNGEYGAVTFSLASMELMYERHNEPCEMLGPHVGKGDMRPLLRLIELSEKQKP
ncbi:ThiF family adenylyltransferase [Sphingobium terrigena]|uniref:ThiF family adenylyltransferase n=2 Tax=Sphingobium terrigena TaxID=2304063 RepID=A0A418YU83_9SPHN|nr:ThiF family adenylyltransferase [Sphingobium terrigena]